MHAVITRIMQPLPLKYHKKVVPTVITGTHKDGFFRVMDDGNKSTYMYQRYNKYTPKSTQLLPDDPVVSHHPNPADDHVINNPNQKLARAGQMTNTGGAPGVSPRGAC